MSVNILPGSLTVTGNVSSTTAAIGGNLIVGGNITVTGNLYSANVNVSGGGGGGGVTNLTTGSGLTSSGSSGAVTISAVVAGLSAGTGISLENTGGTWTIRNTGGGGGNISDWATFNAVQHVNMSGFSINNISNLSCSGNITNISSTSNVIGGVTLCDGTISNLSGSSNYIGGVTLCHGTIINLSGSLNYIGGVILENRKVTIMSDNNEYASITVTVSDSVGKIRTDELRFVSANDTDYGMVIDPELGISLSGGSFSNASTTSNSIGGVTLGDSRVITSTNGTGVAPALSVNGLVGWYNDGAPRLSTDNPMLIQNNVTIQGEYILVGYCNAAGLPTYALSASAGSFSNVPGSSNSIGGVTLQNGVVTPANCSNDLNGYVRLGPIMFQWGYWDTTISGTNVPFNTSFSAPAYNVVISASVGADGKNLSGGVNSINSSNWIYSGEPDGIFWQAIGPA